MKWAAQVLALVLFLPVAARLLSLNDPFAVLSRATRAAAPSLLSPVPAVQDDKEDQILSPASFFGSVSWLDSKPTQTPRADTFSTNWLKGALAPEGLAPHAAMRQQIGCKRQGAHLMRKERRINCAHPDGHADEPPQTAEIQQEGAGHAKHKGSLPPLPLTLPPLPPTLSSRVKERQLAAAASRICLIPVPARQQFGLAQGHTAYGVG